MATILQRQPTFLEQILSSAGQGFGAGVQQGIQEVQRSKKEYAQLASLAAQLYPDDPVAQQRFASSGLEGAKLEIEARRYAPRAATPTIRPEAAVIIGKQQRGEFVSPQEISSLTPEEFKLGARAQEVGALQPAEEQKVFVNKNVERGQMLNEKAANEENTLNILDDMEKLVKSGATSDTLSNIVTEYDLKLLKPLLQSPGSKAYKTGFKELFGDFKTKFGARPTQYEAQIYEQGLPEILSNDDAKLAGIYQAQAIRQADIAESRGYEQAIEELGYKASPAAINKRARQLSADIKKEIYNATRTKIFGLILKGKELKKGESLYYNPKTNKIGRGLEENERDYLKAGFRRIPQGE